MEYTENIIYNPLNGTHYCREDLSKAIKTSKGYLKVDEKLSEQEISYYATEVADMIETDTLWSFHRKYVKEWLKFCKELHFDNQNTKT